MDLLKPQIFLDQSEKDLRQCWSYYNEYENFSFMPDDSIPTDELEWVEEQFAFYAKRIFLRIIALSGYLGMQTFANNLEREFNGFKNLLDQKFSSYHGETTSLLLIVLDSYLVALYSVIGISRSNTQMYNEEILLRVLDSTPSIIQDRKLEPSKELIVRNAVFDHLKYIFPDANMEIQLPKVIKNFKGDIGIKSLKCVIEYKFADSDTEVKRAIGGIYEDMTAYNGVSEWEKFIAIIYQTDDYYTIDQINAELKMSKANENWTVRLLTGRGKRNKTLIKNEKKKDS